MTFRRTAVRLVCAALAVMASVAPAAADGYQVRDDDAARFAVSEFRRHASRNEWRKAVLEIQKLLDIEPGRCAVVAVEGATPPRYESAWAVAVRLFEGLPPEGREVWESMSRRAAEDLLARGIRLRRDDDLAAAARRYPARDVRRRAWDALAHLALARGDFARAASHLESLLGVLEPEAQAQTLARLAFARAQAGDAEGVARVAAQSKHLERAVVPGSPGPEPLGAFVARMLESARASGRASDVRRFGGDAHGRGVSEPPPRPENVSWLSPVVSGFEPGSENEVRYEQPDALSRPVIPVVAQGRIFLNDGLRLRAVDVATGRIAWARDTAQSSAVWRDHPSWYASAAVADGIVYAPLATRSDAPAVDRHFYGQLIIYSMPHRVLHAFDARTGDIVWTHDTERLAGRADAAETDRECVASPPLVVGDDVYVVTWAFSTRYESRLVCFDRRSGATRWRTSLVHAQQESNLFGRPVKEVVVPPLAELDGTIYASTGFGIVAAVDRVTGAIEWLAEHDTTPVPPSYQWFETRDRATTWRASPIAATHTAVVVAPVESDELVAFNPRTGARMWRRPRAAGGGVMHWFLGADAGRAYAAGSRIFAFDLATGADAWPNGAGRIGRDGDRALPACGRPLLTSGEIVAPTIAGIARLDAATGRFLELRQLPSRDDDSGRPPLALRNRHEGDLTSGDGALVVASHSAVEAYFRFDELGRRLEERIIASPDDPRLRLDAGEVYLGAGRLDDGIAALERGLAVLPKLTPAAAARIEPQIRRALVNGLLARARTRRAATDSAGAWADHVRAAAVAVDRGDAVRALFDLAEAGAALGHDAECDAALARIADEFGDVQTVLGDEGRTDAGPLAALRLARRAVSRGDVAAAVDRWMRLLETRPDASLGDTNVVGAVRAEIDAARAAGAADVDALVAARARKSLDVARAAADTVALNRIARTNPSPAIASEAALAAAELHLGQSRPREAAAVVESVTVRMLKSPDVLGRALWLLAEAYSQMQETARERGALRRIVQECPGAKLPDGRGAADAARARLAEERFRDAPRSIADPRPPFVKSWEKLGGTQEPALTYLQIQGSRPKELDDRLLLAQDRTLRLLDSKTGAEVWNVQTPTDPRMTFGAPGRIVISGEDVLSRPRTVRLDGIDAADGRRAWTRALPGRYHSAASSLGVVYVHRWETDDRGDRTSTISAVSMDRGELVAERRMQGGIHPQITAAADALVVWELITQGASPRRRVHTLDAATLSPRGLLELDGPTSPWALAVPGTTLVATTVAHNGVAAVDVSDGSLAWEPFRLRGRSVKSLLVVPGGIIVTDDADQVHRLDPATGKETWVRPLAADGMSFGYNGEAAEGDLVVVTLVSPREGTPAIAVALDAATGAERWRREIPIAVRALPRPEILGSHVAYEVNVRKGGNEGDCRVDFLSRADGTVAGSVSHPDIGRSMQRAFYAGGDVILLLPLRADIAVFAGAAAPR